MLPEWLGDFWIYCERFRDALVIFTSRRKALEKRRVLGLLAGSRSSILLGHHSMFVDTLVDNEWLDEEINLSILKLNGENTYG